MTFYNPFFPHFPRISYPQSTNATQNVNKSTHTSNTSNTNQCNSTCNNSSYNANSCKTKEDNCKTSVPKVYQKNFKSQGILQNYLKETDTLIILGLLFFLYTQENKDFSLMLCLFLLLFDN